MTRKNFDRAIGLVFSGSQAHQVCNEYIKSLEKQCKAKDEEIERLKKTLQNKFIRNIDNDAELRATLKRMASK